MVNHITIFGIEITVNTVAFTIPIGSGWNVYWYGIIIAFGFLMAMIYGLKNAKRFEINEDHMINSVIVVLPVAVLFARAYYLAFDGVKMKSIGEFFGIGTGYGFAGLAIYGGVIGAVLAILLMCKIYKMPLFSVLDITSIGFLIGQSIGRWGNFVNQEAYGTFTGSSWFGMTSNRIYSETGSHNLVHPTFLYESIWCAIGFFVLHRASKKRKFNGQIALMYGAWYGFGRSFIELLRTDSLTISGQSSPDVSPLLRVSFLLSVALCIGSVAALTVILNRIKSKEEATSYVPQFGGVEVDLDGAVAATVAEQNISGDNSFSQTESEPGEESDSHDVPSEDDSGQGEEDLDNLKLDSLIDENVSGDSAEDSQDAKTMQSTDTQNPLEGKTEEDK